MTDRGETEPPSGPPPDPRWPGRDAPFLALAIVLALAVANLPYIAGWISAPFGWRFTGMVGSAMDVASYHAKMRAGEQGRWLYTSAYTTEPHAPAFIYMYYVALGHAARIAHLGIPVVYQLARAASAILLVFSAHLFLFRLGLSRSARWFALALLLTASGIGWVIRLPFIARVPPEFWFLEAYVFQSLVAYPHFAFSTALILLILAEVWHHPRRPGPGTLLRAALASFLLGCAHPRVMLVPILVGGAAALTETRDLARLRLWAAGLGAALLGFLPAAAAALLTIGDDPVWQATQTPTPMPYPWIFLAAYGFLWPLGAAGAWLAYRRREPWGPLILAWILVGAFLPYAPIGAQRRLIHGFNIPLAIGAADLIYRYLLPRLASSAARFSLAVACVAALSISSWVYLVHEAALARRAMYPQSIPVAQSDAMAWIAANVPPQDVTIAKPVAGMFIPADTGRRVVFGHWAETIDPKYKSWAVAKFFSSATEPRLREEIVKSFDIRWAVVSPQESAPDDHDFGSAPARWRQAWRDGGWIVYERIGPADLAAEAGAPPR